MKIRWAVAVPVVAALALTGCGGTAIRGVAPGDEKAERATRIVDGDTFKIGERRIRVLGINSCEKNTPGGSRATADAEELLGRPLALTRGPGIDVELRYVFAGDQDYGSVMVVRDHTEVYQGRNDAAPEYVA